MFELAIIAGVAMTPLQASESINEFCAEVVGFSFAEDVVTQDEWSRFVYCRNTIRRPVK